MGFSITQQILPVISRIEVPLFAFPMLHAEFAHRQFLSDGFCAPMNPLHISTLILIIEEGLLCDDRSAGVSPARISEWHGFSSESEN
jgi:hypothetical protein